MIVVGGENLVDLLVTADGSITAALGGSPYNTVRTIGRLGVPVGFLGRISDDRFGRQLRAGLEADGVDTSLVTSTSDPTLLAIAELHADGHASYRFYTAGTAASGMRPADVEALLAAPPGVLHVGSIALDLEPTASALVGAVEAIDPSTLVSLDPNCRPSIIADVDSYRARLLRLVRRADIVKASTEDLEVLLPARAPLDAAAELLASGPRLVLVTDGSRPVRVLGRDGLALTIPVPSVRVVDTVGAGDAFAGGFLARWVEHGRGRAELGDVDALRQAASFAVAVAALVCTRPGAQPPTRAEVEASGLLADGG